MHLYDQWHFCLCSYPSALPSNQRCDEIRATRLSCPALMSHRNKVFPLLFLTVLWWQGRDGGALSQNVIHLWRWGLRPPSTHSEHLIPSGFPLESLSDKEHERLSTSTRSFTASRHFSSTYSNINIYLQEWQQTHGSQTKAYNGE